MRTEVYTEKELSGACSANGHEVASVGPPRKLTDESKDLFIITLMLSTRMKR